MDSASHYLEAERLIRIAEDLTPHRLDEEAGLIQLAQVHATLALAAATALTASDEGGMPFEDCLAWISAASVTAPIPPETDGQDDEPGPDSCCAHGPACIECATGLTVGSSSPTDPDELRAWLHALPHRAIVLGADGYPYQRGTGYETVHGQPDREYPALITLGGTPKELSDDHFNDVLDLADNVAPFTVLYLGQEA